MRLTDQGPNNKCKCYDENETIMEEWSDHQKELGKIAFDAMHHNFGEQKKLPKGGECTERRESISFKDWRK